MLDHPNLEPVRLVARRGRRTRLREGYKLEQPWAYIWQTQLRPSGEDLERQPLLIERQIRIPAGFLSDGASVPRMLWTCTEITPDGLIRAAALVHDALYRHRGQLPAGWLFERPAGITGWIEVAIENATYTRQSADAMFARIMRDAGMDQGKRRKAYRGVRACGWATWIREPEVLELAEAA